MPHAPDVNAPIAARLSALGDAVFDIQNELGKRGFAAYLPMQADLFAWAQDDAERAELGTYLREMAKETIGAVARPGGILMAGDGYVSPYLERLRKDRDAAVGDFEAYRAALDRSPFELNPVVKRAAVARAHDTERWKLRTDAAISESKQIKEREAAQAFGSIVGNFRDVGQRLGVLWTSLQDGAFCGARARAGSRQLRRNALLSVVPVCADWNIAVVLPNVSSFSGLGAGNLAALDTTMLLVQGDIDRLLRAATLSLETGMHLRLAQLIKGFGAYWSARSLSELALCIRAQYALIDISLPRLSAALNGLSLS
jgi:hypothetical protein